MPFENLLNISVKKDWVDYLSAMLTPTVAIFGLYIGYRQWRTEEAKFRHELFDRRYKQFEAVKRFVFSVIDLTVQDNEDCMVYKAGDSLWPEIAGMEFIFNLEIEQYVREHIMKPYMEIQDLRTFYDWMVPRETLIENTARQSELKRNLMENLKTFQEKTFEYMQLDQPSLSKKLWRHLAALWEKIQKAAEE